MKLMLTSSGLDSPRLRREFSNMLEQKVAQARVIVIHTAQKPKHMVYLDEIGKNLSRNGVLLPNITYLNIAKEDSHPKLSNYPKP